MERWCRISGSARIRKNSQGLPSIPRFRVSVKNRGMALARASRDRKGGPMKQMFAAVTMVCLTSGFVLAQTAPQATIKKEPAKNTLATDGPGMFQSYCSPCHGKSGKGNGPAASALKTKPADLTTVAKRHGGTFSVKDFEDRIN